MLTVYIGWDSREPIAAEVCRHSILQHASIPVNIVMLKQQELRRLESLYFGPKGDMFLLRKQLVKPVQDQVYNSVQNIATRRNYDFVFDKSSELVMLYSNKKHDISELVLSSIVRDRKISQKKEKQANKGLTEKQKKAQEAKDAARKKKEADRVARKKKIDEARKKRLAEIEAKRKLLKEKKDAAKKKKEQDKKKEEQDNN